MTRRCGVTVCARGPRASRGRRRQRHGNHTRRRPADSGGPQRSPPQFSSRPHRRRCKAPFWTGTWSQIHWPKGTARCGGHRDSYGRPGPPFPHGSSRASQCRAGHRARDSPAEATSKRRSHRRVRRGETGERERETRRESRRRGRGGEGWGGEARMAFRSPYGLGRQAMAGP